jgi:hypothetical protein
LDPDASKGRAMPGRSPPDRPQVADLARKTGPNMGDPAVDLGRIGVRGGHAYFTHTSNVWRPGCRLSRPTWISPGPAVAVQLEHVAE